MFNITLIVRNFDIFLFLQYYELSLDFTENYYQFNFIKKNICHLILLEVYLYTVYKLKKNVKHLMFIFHYFGR